MTPHPLPWALGWSNMKDTLMFGLAFRPFKNSLKKRRMRKQDGSDHSCSALVREDLEAIFAYELRVANADILKMKVYGKSERFHSARIVPVGPEHQV
jgi:hypothetical protein